MTQRDLGALGEFTLAGWAAATGIKAQRVTHDCTGWDYLLEFLPARGDALPLYPQDKEPASISCLVQVKATGVGNLNRQVSLTNWQLLITHPLPVFFLVIDFGEGVVPQTAYLVPVDSEAIRQVLRRIRELDSKSEGIAGHSMSVLCKEEHRLEAPDGESLERAIRSHIGSSFEECVRRKLEVVQKVGYEESRYQFTFQLSEEELQGISPLECLVDLSLGLRGPLPVSHAEFRDLRFGIPARVPDQEFTTGELEIIPEPVETVEVTLSLGMHVARTTMEMFLPRGLPLEEVLAAGLLKILLRSEFVCFVAGNSSMNISFHLSDSQEVSRLCDLYEFAKVVLFLEESAKKKGDSAIYVRSGSRILFSRSFRLDGMIIPENIVRLAEGARNAWEIAKRLDVQDKVALTVDILLAQEERLRILWSLLVAEEGCMKISWFWSQEQVNRNTRVCVPFGVEIILGDLKGTVMFSVWGDVQRTGLEQEECIQCELVTTEKRLERTFTTRKGEKGLSLSAAVHAIADAYDDVTCLILEHYALPANS